MYNSNKICLRILLQLNYLVPLMPPIEKKWEECFGLKFFDREWRNIKLVLLMNDEDRKLGDVTPLELSSLWFANL